MYNPRLWGSWVQQTPQVPPSINYAMSGIYISIQGSVKGVNAMALQVSAPHLALGIL